MSEEFLCPICLEDLISRDGHAKIISGCCNNTFHYNCYLKYTTHQNRKDCPLCRNNFNKNNQNIYDIEILNGPSESIIIEIIPTYDYSINILAAEVAYLLSYNETNQLSIYYKLKLELNYSCLIFKLDGIKLNSKCIVPRNYSGKLSVYIEETGWKDHIKQLKSSGYNKLVNFFNKDINFNDTYYELGCALRCCMSLLSFTILRDDNIEDEILEVMEDALKNNRSIYDALRYKFY